MLICVLFYLLTLCSIEPKTIETTKPKRVFAMKKGIRDYNRGIPIGTSDFMELVKNSKLFVDNSLFIQDVLQRNDSKLFLLCPRQWGKTTNLGMFRAFFEIQVDNEGNRIPQECATNYKLFAKGEVTLEDGTIQNLQSPLLIANNKTIMETYQGQYPVINVTFKDALGDDLDTVTEKVRNAICRAFREHEYLVHVIPRAAADAANSISRVLTDMEDQQLKAHLECDSSVRIEEALRFLAQLLHSRFKQKVVILLDDFDVPIHNYLRVRNFDREEIFKIFHLMEDIAMYTTVLNYHYHRAIIFGTNQLSQALYQYFGHFNSYLWHHVAMRSHPLHDYFGFSRSQIKELFEKQRFNRFLSERASQWYNGYESKDFNETYYNPVSILNFLNRKHIAIYKRAEKNDYIKNVIAMQPDIRKALIGLISQQNQNISSVIARGEKIGTEDEINYLKRLSKDSIHPTYWQKGIFLLYLVTEGYLTRVPNTGITRVPANMSFLAAEWLSEYYKVLFQLNDLPNLCEVKLPNIETTYIVSTWMVSYYKTRFNIQEELLQKAAGDLFDFVTEEFVETDAVENTLTALLEASASALQVEDSLEDVSNTTTETPIQSVLNCVMLRVQCLSQFEILVHYNRIRKADYLVIHNKTAQGIVIQISSNDTSASAARDFAEKRRYLLHKRKNIHKMKFVGINIASNYTVTAAVRCMIREHLLDEKVDTNKLILKTCI